MADIQLVFGVAPGSYNEIDSQLQAMANRIHPEVRIKVKRDGTITEELCDATKESAKLQSALQSAYSELGKARISSDPNKQIYTQQIQEYIRALNDLDTKLNSGSLTSDGFAKEFGQLGDLFARLKTQMSSLDADVFAKMTRAVNTGEIETKLSSVCRKFDELGQASEKLSNNRAALESYVSTMTDDNASMSSRVDAYQKFLSLLPTVTAQLKEEAAAQKQSSDAASEAAAAMQRSLETGDAETRLDSVVRRLGDLNSASQNLLGNSVNLASYFEIMADGSRTMEERTAAFNSFNALLPTVNRQISEQAQVDKAATAAAKEAETANQGLANKTNDVGSSMKSAGSSAESFVAKLKNIAAQALGISSSYMAIRKLISVFKQGVKTIVELDTALVDLQKTTTMSASEMEDFYYAANEQAKQLGVTTKDIISSASEWSRLGFSDQKSATQMASFAAQFAAISPGVDIEKATSGLISIMKGFGIEVDDVLDGIMSKVNIVGNNFAVSNGDIIDGMQRISAVMSAMDQDIDSTIALFTAANEVIQDASMSATALRTLSLRIRGYDEETEELSEDLVNITGDIVDLTKTASNPEGISIFTDETQTQYKDLVEYFRELSSIWDELEEKNQTALLNDLFGKRGAQAGSALIKNFSAVDRALELMGHSAGNADAEMAVVTQSIEYHLNQLKQTWVSIAQDVFRRDDIIDVVDALTVLSEIIGEITGSLGLLGTGALAGGFGAFIKNFDREIALPIF